MPARKDYSHLIGERFGRLTVQSIARELCGKGRQTRPVATCRCQCGQTVRVLVYNLLTNNTHSCGCLRNETVAQLKKRHGKRHTSTYRSWCDMIQRATNPNRPVYKYYGGRGIKVCDRWLGPNGFENFYADMGEKPSSKHSLDRIDPNGNYCPENCRWATREEQANNKSNNRHWTHDGRTQTPREWSREVGIKRTILYQRIYYLKWSVARALTTPVGKRCQKS